LMLAQARDDYPEPARRPRATTGTPRRPVGRGAPVASTLGSPDVRHGVDPGAWKHGAAPPADPSGDQDPAAPASAPVDAATRLDAVLRQIAEGVIVTDAKGHIEFVNDAAREIHGRAVLGVPVEEY